jgi:hypothetical protein
MKEEIDYYDPRIRADEDDSLRSAVVWSTKSVELALGEMLAGRSVKRSPFYEGNPDWRKGDIVFKYSEWEINEIQKCSANILYFINTYCKVKRPDGEIGTINLRRYQYKQILDFIENDEIILGWSRQSGKTIGTALYIAHAMIFDADKATALLANKSRTSGEVLDKIKEIMKQLPFFMKPGILGLNSGTMSFDNGCRIFCAPTTIDALNGKTCNILYIDEFAFVGKGRNKIEYQKEFLANAKPILSSQKDSGLCKLIISSTPMGKEYFYELFYNALLGKNYMKASKVCWWEIPGKTIDWAKKEIASIGLSKFKMQYEMSFDVHSETLLSMKTMRRLSKYKKDFISAQFDILSDYEDCLFFDKDIEIDQENDVFCLSVDIAEGLKRDYSVIQIIRLEFNQITYRFEFVQVGVFASNEIPIEKFAAIARELFNSLNPNYSKLLVEYNTYGEFFFKCLNDINSEEEVPLESIVKFKRNSDSETKIKGLRTNTEVKKIAIKSFKSLTDDNQLKVEEDLTIKEIENFQITSKGTYSASIGHDDRVTPLINFSYWVQLNEPEYQYWTEEYAELNQIDIDEAAFRMKVKMVNSDEPTEDNLTEEEKQFLS